MRAVIPEIDRRPLAGVGKKVAAALAVLGSLVSTLATVGAITADQSTTVQAALVALGTLATAVTAVLAAFGVVRKGEPLVTPMSDPRADDMTPLHPIPGAGVVDLTNRPPGPDSPLR